MIWLVALVALGVLADYITTKRVIERGGRELNPLPRWIMGRFGPEAWLALELGVAVWVVIAGWPATWPGLLAAAALFSVAFWNSRVK